MSEREAVLHWSRDIIHWVIHPITACWHFYRVEKIKHHGKYSGPRGGIENAIEHRACCCHCNKDVKKASWY